MIATLLLATLLIQWTWWTLCRHAPLTEVSLLLMAIRINIRITIGAFAC
jgi:hypothetical protein